MKNIIFSEIECNASRKLWSTKRMLERCNRQNFVLNTTWIIISIAVSFYLQSDDTRKVCRGQMVNRWSSRSLVTVAKIFLSAFHEDVLWICLNFRPRLSLVYRHCTWSFLSKQGYSNLKCRRVQLCHEYFQVISTIITLFAFSTNFTTLLYSRKACCFFLLSSETDIHSFR